MWNLRFLGFSFLKKLLADDQVVYYFIIDEIYAYVHNLSPLKKSRKQVTYFNCDLQTNEETYGAVSFKSDFHSVLTETSANKSPVKITGFKRRANFRNNIVEDIELNHRSSVTVLSPAEVSFEYHTVQEEPADIKSVQDILDNG